ncbi:hypothetical protein PG996_009862 [Apiospora saccharicola]|uniref:Uncharacterized protein n=1 Tax=Apiospora saccharicola TaxID=335842 RepID=A0ABR1UMM7_9PEZI
MALWPFRRKGSRKRPPGNGRQAADAPGPSRAATEPATSSDPVDAAPSSLEATGRRASKRQRQQRGDLPDQHQWRGRTYSFSPGRRDSIRVARARPCQHDPVPPVPAIPKSATTISDHDIYREQGPSNHTIGHTLDSQNPEMDIRDRVPTLHHNNSGSKRSAQHLPRHKSSKRRKEDHDREAEVKAMSQLQPPPTRPATDSWTSGRPMKRNSKRARTGPARPWDQRESDISLPGPESINSAMSTDSDQIAWKLSSLDALAPRPTLRYSSNPLYGASSGSGPLRSVSQKRKLAERGPIPESTLRAHKRVDDLADDLDASDLRELMERDKRRKERKTERDRERVERRLVRKSERQRAEEAEAARNGTPPPQNLERGVLGRDTVGLGIDTTSAVVTSSRQRQSDDYPRKREKEPAKPAEEPQDNRRSPSPLENFHRVDSIPLSPVTPAPAVPQPKPTEPANETEPRTSRSSSPRLMGLIRPKKQRSASPKESKYSKEKPDAAEKASTPSSMRVASRSEESESGGQTSDGGSSSKPWSFFKWGRRNKRDSGPSSFSNTSRDSMSTHQHPQPINYMPRQLSSKVPKRTMSRFREDLPELPLSPPDSRVASPEAEGTLAEPLPVIPDDVVMRYDTPTSGHRATPISMHREEVMTSPPPQSMSLASIGSEGSWLSGGRMGNRKRASSGVQASLTSYPVGSPSRNSEEHEIDQHSIADDEFLKTVVDDKLRRQSTGEALPSSDDENDDLDQSPKWGNVKHTPTMMHHRDTMRSREGLLETYEDDEKDVSVEQANNDEMSEGENPGIPQRATSVKVSDQIRNFNRGSAKLLEISPRPSGERRRSSQEPVTQ